ncbi:MAG: lytic transglycosylase domain-containing protein [Candidatus Delongbacteria bacterium]|nr:lytic transglycosylase domain-containing protein [Candidatus Delongbacteria bacterium]MBN2836292.1 lytic transglycosylase domain-containing protein [Candidatus Delongbacteria bacterium]
MWLRVLFTLIFLINLQSQSVFDFEEISFAGSKVPLDKYDVKERIKKEYFKLLLDRKGYLLELYDNYMFYEKMLLQAFDREGLHHDYIYVAAVESGFDPRTVSSRGASGLWQFMKPTGQKYGLRIDEIIDERNHPDLSTEAFIKHIKILLDKYNDSFKVLAAYNNGEFAFDQTLQNQKMNDYWDCISNHETSEYVPKIVAMKLIFSEVEKNRLSTFADKTFDKYKNIEIVFNESLSFDDFCSMLNISYREFYQINSHLIHDSYRKGGRFLTNGNYNLYIPYDKVKLCQNIFSVNRFLEYEASDTIFVKIENETIGELALIYGINWRELARQNDLKIEKRKNGLEYVDLVKGQEIIIIR